MAYKIRFVMREFLRLAESYKVYIDEFDEAVLSKTSMYDEIFGANEVFFRCFFYILKDFLNDPNSDEMLIKIPIKELGTSDNAIDTNWRRFQDVITDVLGMATIDKQENMLKQYKLDHVNLGKFFYCHNDKPIIDGRDEPTLWEIVRSENTQSGIRPKELYPERIHYPHH